MRFTVLRSKTVSCWICDKQHQSPLVNYMPTTRQWETQNSMFCLPIDCFFPDFLRAQNVVWVIKGKIILKWSEGKQKLLRVTGRFELLRVRVTEGKITVNVWWKSRRKWFWFEIAQGSRYQESTVIFSHTVNSYMYKQWTNDNY